MRSTNEGTASKPELPSYPWRFAHLAALWAFGVAQPIFSMLQANPEFLVVRGSTRADVVVFAALLVVLPPLAVVVIEALVGKASRSLGAAFHLVALGCFAFLTAVQLLRRVDPQATLAWLLPLVPAALLVVAYRRWGIVRSFLGAAAVLPLLGGLYFVATVPLAVDDRAGLDVEVRSNTPVVLVVFDELPVSSLLRADGSLDEVRYPSFARLANGATWYRHTTAAHASSTQAVPAILTGRLPREGDVPTLAKHPDNVFTLLGERYAVRGHEQVTRLCPTRYCPRSRPPVEFADRQRGLFYDSSVVYLHRVLPPSIRGALPPIGQRWGGFGEGSRVDTRELVLGALDKAAWNWALLQARGHENAQFEEFLRSVNPTDPRRTLYVEHALFPHTPWYFLPSGKRYGGALLNGIEQSWTRWRTSRILVDQALQRHKLQVGYTDRLLGRLLRRLESAGIYDRALLVVTADHGASFRPGGYFRDVESRNVGDIAGVPLFVKYPGQRAGRIDARHAKTVDIVPTIADVIGVRLPWLVDGSSLRGPAVERPVEIGTFGAATVRVDRDVVERGVRATARRNAALLGEGRESLYRLGPQSELIGRTVRSFGRVDTEEAVRFREPARYDDVRSSAVFVPARIVGSIDSPRVHPGSPLAVAVNGTVRGTTKALNDGTGIVFDVLVPETSFREGANHVELFLAETSGGGARLARLGSTGRGVRHTASRSGLTAPSVPGSRPRRG